MSQRCYECNTLLARTPDQYTNSWWCPEHGGGRPVVERMPLPGDAVGLRSTGALSAAATRDRQADARRDEDWRDADAKATARWTKTQTDLAEERAAHDPLLKAQREAERDAAKAATPRAETPKAEAARAEATRADTPRADAPKGAPGPSGASKP